MLISIVARLDPVTEIYAWCSGMGAVGVILLMALTSIAVIAFGRRRRDRMPTALDQIADEAAAIRSSPAVTVAATLGGLGLLMALAISVWNLPLLVGGGAAAVVCGVILVVVFVTGLLAPGQQKRQSAEPSRE
ncbi:hypothetical protein ACPZ19_50305 [Amycolatopsis lurida]